MNKLTKLYSIIAISTLALTGCARELSSSTYTSGAVSGKVIEGTVISARPVTIKDADKLQDNTLGILGGGVLGGVGGSAFGKGTGKGLAAVGGALLGATAGAYAQDKLSTSNGMEYIVRIDKKYVNSIPTNTSRKEVQFGTSSAEQDVSKSIQVENTKTDLISVLQGSDVVFSAGQHVLVIYNNDRPRLAPSN